MTLRTMISTKESFLDAVSADLEVRGGPSSLLAPAFDAIGGIETIVTPLIEASVKRFDVLETESKVQIRMF